MSSKQTRRSVSVKGTTHQRIKDHLKGGSVAGFVEKLIEEKLGAPTDEERRKFGEWLEAREKGPEAVTAVKEPDEQQAQPPSPPKPLLDTGPEETLIAKSFESVNIPEDAFQDAGLGAGLDVAQPEPELKAEPEPELKSTKRPLSKGRPLPAEVENSEDSDLDDYIPPIQLF